MRQRAALAAAVAAFAWSLWPIPYRLVRNCMMRATVPSATRAFACLDRDLATNVTIVVTVKDTCTQAVDSLLTLASMVPRDMPILYVYPDFYGCNRFDVDVPLLPNIRRLKLHPTSSPIDGFLAAKPFLTTPFVLLMHNDCYMSGKADVCELYRALEANPSHPFAAPQIFERSHNGIVVPHTHHKRLHIREGGGRSSIAYELDLELMTRRTPADFASRAGPQLDFMEDHSYMARSATFDEYLDGRASHTYEYFDSIMAMRSRNTSAWYTPSSSFVFDVDYRKLGWKDIPYFVYKRSELLGNEVCAYLSAKWRVTFPVTGIWNYVRLDMLHRLSLGVNALPDSRADQRALFYSWFESVGFNRYNGRSLAALLADDASGGVALERTTNVSAASVERAVPPASAFLERRGAAASSGAADFAPIAFTLTPSCRPSSCGMLVVDARGCRCFVYHPPYEVREYPRAVAALDLVKLPSRVLKYLQMSRGRRRPGGSFACDANTECAHATAFDGSSRLVKWGWLP